MKNQRQHLLLLFAAKSSSYKGKERKGKRGNGVDDFPFVAIPLRFPGKTYKIEALRSRVPEPEFLKKDFGVAIDTSGLNGTSAIFDIGNRIGKAGADFGACLNGLVHQFFRGLPVPVQHEEIAVVPVRPDMAIKNQRAETSVGEKEDLWVFTEWLRDFGFTENDTGSDGSTDEEMSWFNLRSVGFLGRP